MIEKIAIDVSNMLNNSTPSRDFDGLVGMGAHMEKMELLLRLDLDEVRMIGIWGPSGIGKTTIARFLFNQLCSSFQLSVFMENIKELMYTRPVCSDDYSAKLHLQKQFMSQIINNMDIEVPHLGVAQDRLHDKKVLIVLDSIDQSIQLDAIAKENRWFGHGSRIIITTQDQKLLKGHGINHIYKVDFPSTYEALQIFCMYAFGKKFPEDGFEKLAWEVTSLLGELPLGLRVMGSHFRGMSKQEWINALPRLRIHLDASIQSILKFSYDALCDDDKDLFLHIACLFNLEQMEKAEEYLVNDFLDVRHGLHILAEKSLITIDKGWIKMHKLLEKLGKEIVRHEPGHQSIREPGKRQFLVDGRDRPLGNLKRMDLTGTTNLKELPDLSTAINLQNLYIGGCSSLVELPSSIGNVTDLQKLYLGGCSSLVELPSSIENNTNLLCLDLMDCSNLVKLPSSIGNLHKLQRLYLKGCSKLEVLPININLESLEMLTFEKFS